VRKLLNEVVKREKQSAASLQKAKGRGGRYAEANGRLEARDVEAEIAGAISRADGNNRNGSNGGIGGGGQLKAKEQVYLKATGRAIPRVLEIGLHFQTEKDCWVKVEMGSVSAIDDIEVKRRTGTAEVGTREAEAEAEEEAEADDVPETRIRTLSSVIVTIGLK
jgi:ribonuclease P/MRP protein subunit POP7